MERVPLAILNWNKWPETIACARSVLDAGETRDVWIIDNGSDEWGEASCREFGETVRLERLETNFGWAGGYNRAIRRISAATQATAIYLLNNDAAVKPNFLRAA